MTAPAVVYALFRALVPAEDRWLRGKFGAQYDEHRRLVLVKVFSSARGPAALLVRAGAEKECSFPAPRITGDQVAMES